MQSYLKIYLLCFVALLSVVAGLNFVIDPNGRFRVIDRAGFNQVKISDVPDSRQGKANALRQCDYGTVILGSSRAETGIFPRSKQFIDKPIYNAALIGTSMRELGDMADYVVAHQDPETIVIGLDFLMFSALRDTAGDLSIDTLDASITTLNWNMQGIALRCYFNGHNDKRGTRVNHREAFDTILEIYIRNPSLYGDFELNEPYLARLEETVRMLRAESVDVKLFISPLHAVLLELLNNEGLMPSFRDWKRALVAMVARLNADKGTKQELKLWDFSGYNSVTTEVIPEAGSKQQMQWYRDPAHYRVAAGNLVLKRLLDSAEPIDDMPPDFGMIITADTIEARFALEDERARAFRNAQPDEVRRTFEIAATARLMPPTMVLESDQIAPP
jgi:hypothetical protein